MKSPIYALVFVLSTLQLFSQNIYTISDLLPYEIVLNASGTSVLSTSISKNTLGLTSSEVKLCQTGACQTESVLFKLYKNGNVYDSLFTNEINGVFTSSFVVLTDTVNSYRIKAFFRYYSNCINNTCDVFIHEDSTEDFISRKRITYEYWYLPTDFNYNCSNNTFSIGKTVYASTLGAPEYIDQCNGWTYVTCQFVNNISFILYKDGVQYSSQLVNATYLNGKKWAFNFTVPSGVYGNFQVKVRFNYVTTYGLFGALNWYHFVEDYSEVYVVNDPSQYCCVSHKTISGNVNFGAIDKKETSASIDANNTINSGASAIYHAGTTVKLIPNFKANQGSYFHAYIEGCTGSFNRFGNYEDRQTIGDSIGYNTELKFRVGFNSEPNPEIVVIPNPNQGNFKILFTNSDELPTSITIESLTGQNVFKTLIPNATPLNIDIEWVVNGMYILKVVYSNKTCIKKLIKN